MPAILDLMEKEFPESLIDIRDFVSESDSSVFDLFGNYADMEDPLTYQARVITELEEKISSLQPYNMEFTADWAKPLIQDMLES